ncbi:hypothetical protein NDU88_002101 [Pleurodeles waltl]|uniref:Uncharacterized protein n=1 Tax=Pleurodeles waltl TaxID=8319 RepID=A0AAV7TKV5_PLEWA|nr:hypothetical protein NDU88_002101 [Pleurodeles waltl]
MLITGENPGGYPEQDNKKHRRDPGARVQGLLGWLHPCTSPCQDIEHCGRTLTTSPGGGYRGAAQNPRPWWQGVTCGPALVGQWLRGVGSEWIPVFCAVAETSSQVWILTPAGMGKSDVKQLKLQFGAKTSTRAPPETMDKNDAQPVQEKHSEMGETYTAVKQKMRQANIPYAMLHPARLKITHKGRSMIIAMPQQANDYLKQSCRRELQRRQSCYPEQASTMSDQD